MATTEAPSVWERLAAPFDDTDIKLRPLEVKTAKDWKKPTKQYGKYTEPCKAKYAVYIDARNVEDRLDAVVGQAAWMDEYRELKDGSMLCRLSIRDTDGVWLYKEGVGYPNSDNDDEPYKGAESDALKRAAVKWGIGRQLYSMTHYMGIDLSRWQDCDEYGQPGKATAPRTAEPKTEAKAPAPLPTNDPGYPAFDAMWTTAELKDNKKAVWEMLGKPADKPAAFAAYKKLGKARREAVEKVADGTITVPEGAAS